MKINYNSNNDDIDFCLLQMKAVGDSDQSPYENPTLSELIAQQADLADTYHNSIVFSQSCQTV